MTDEEMLTRAMDIGEQLLVSGGEISRVEDTVRRICNAYGVRQSHVFSIASSIIVSVETAEKKWITQTRRIAEYGTDLYRLDRLNALSRYICAERPDAEEIDRRYEKILQSTSYSMQVQCLFSALIAAAFAVFFGGDMTDGLCAAAGGFSLRIILVRLQKMKANPIFANTLTATIVGLICILTCRFGPGKHLNEIMIGNIMLLIPGVLLTNSFRDFISGDMLTGLLHFIEAIIIAVCVAGGFMTALVMMGETI
jgi:uncharacterized membrane protein YjjP (DUF1212 family)